MFNSRDRFTKGEETLMHVPSKVSIKMTPYELYKQEKVQKLRSLSPSPEVGKSRVPEYMQEIRFRSQLEKFPKKQLQQSVEASPQYSINIDSSRKHYHIPIIEKCILKYSGNRPKLPSFKRKMPSLGKILNYDDES
jgi:hypothetical protein